MLQKRLLLFLFGCIGIRTLLAFIAHTVPLSILPYMGFVALFPVIGWIYIYLTNSRQTGPEVFGSTIWWNSLRIPHAMLYSLFAIYAFQKNPNAWYFLLIDVIFGFAAFITYHFY